jgi:Transglutaminase-like superfamily
MRAEALRRRYLAEAAVALAVARLAVRFLPPAWVFAWAGRFPRRIQRFRRDEIEWISWAIDTTSSSPRMQALRLPCAIAAQTMLRRRGIASRLCLGVARRDDGLVTHAWLESGDDIILGGGEARGFTKIAQFGKDAA